MHHGMSWTVNSVSKCLCISHVKEKNGGVISPAVETSFLTADYCTSYSSRSVFVLRSDLFCRTFTGSRNASLLLQGQTYAGLQVLCL